MSRGAAQVPPPILSGHTPGPWSWRDVSGAGLEIYGPVRELHSVDLPHGMPDVIQFYTLVAPQNVLIAAERWVQFEPKGWHEMQVANARLIAAAPDLLAALHEAREFIYDHVDVVDGDYGIPAPNRAMSLLPEIDAAIAKATKPVTSRPEGTSESQSPKGNPNPV